MPTVSKPLQTLGSLPILENGNQFEREEFLARWEQHLEFKHAELIYGIVYLNAAATSFIQHGHPHALMSLLLTTYSLKTPGTITASSNTTKLGKLIVLEPDVFLGIEEKYGGQCKIDTEGYIASAPELVVEIAASSVSRDLHIKKAVYAKFGVKEYIVWRTEEHAIDWFILRGNDFVTTTFAQGIIKCTVFPGLWLDVTSLLINQGSKALELLQSGVNSNEQLQFQQELTSRLQTIIFTHTLIKSSSSDCMISKTSGREYYIHAVLR